MRISDWSSDVCSSDLCDPFILRPVVSQKVPTRGLVPISHRHYDHTKRNTVMQKAPHYRSHHPDRNGPGARAPHWHEGGTVHRPTYRRYPRIDRKSVVTGTRVLVRVDLSGRRYIKKKKK